MAAEDNFSVEVLVGECREEVKRLAAEVAELNGRIEGLTAMIENLGVPE